MRRPESVQASMELRRSMLLHGDLASLSIETVHVIGSVIAIRYDGLCADAKTLV